MIETYPDLASKRFLVIADFEDPAQASMFRMTPGTTDPVAVSTEQAQMKTGVGSLKVSLPDDTRRLVCEDSPENQWALPRDWSQHNLLLFSVFSPRDLTGFRFGLSSGTQIKLHYEHPSIMLKTGWNLIRVDLGDLSDSIDVTDIRQMRFACHPLDAPITFYLDDMILVDNSSELFASPEREPGDLYVRAQGRRLVVGAVGRFELVFSHGRIRQWFDLTNDPASTHNLVGPGFVGPSPLRVVQEADESSVVDAAEQWAARGAAIETVQSLLEANPFCVVIEGEWRFLLAKTAPFSTGPYHRWVHTVYPDGRVYVHCSGTARTGTASDDPIGMAFHCDGTMKFDRCLAGPGRNASDIPTPFALFSRPGQRQADLLVVPFKALSGLELDNLHDTRLAAMWTLPDQDDPFSFAAMIRVWPPDIDSPEQAVPLAADYCRPLPIDVDAGQLVRTDPGDLDNDGFSEASGCYVLQLEGNIAKVHIDGRKQLRFSPVFKLVDVADRDVWAYLDGRQIRRIQRNADNNVLFQIPDVISGRALLEVTSRPRQPSEPADAP